MTIRRERTKRARWISRVASVGVLGMAACGLAPRTPDGQRAPLPDPVIAPWSVVELRVCADLFCREALPELASIDVLRTPGGYAVSAVDRDGAVYDGLLERADGWSLHLSRLGEPPSVWWASDGIASIDRVSPTLALVAARDGAAMGWLALDPMQIAAQPWLTRVAGELAAIVAPSAWLEGDTATALLGDGEGALLGFSGPVTEAAQANGWRISAAEVSTPDGPFRWAAPEHLGDADLGRGPDGGWRVFFGASGVIEFENGSFTESYSVGFAYASAEGRFAPYPYNPVHDRTFAFILHADERSPSVAIGDEEAVMLYVESRPGSAPAIALAVHPLGT